MRTLNTTGVDKNAHTAAQGPAKPDPKSLVRSAVNGSPVAAWTGPIFLTR